MTSTRPPTSSSVQDKNFNPIFPPTSQSIANGARAVTFPPNISMPPSQTNTQAFPSTAQMSSNVPNTKINYPTQPASTISQANLTPTQSTTNTDKSHSNQLFSSPNVFKPQTTSTPTSSNIQNINGTFTSPGNVSQTTTQPTTLLASTFSNSPISQPIHPIHSRSTPPPLIANTYQSNLNPVTSPSYTHNINAPPSSTNPLTAKTTVASLPSSFQQSMPPPQQQTLATMPQQQKHISNQQQFLFPSSQQQMLPPPPQLSSTPQQLQAAAFQTSQNSTLPPPPPANTYQPISNSQSATVHPSIRPMYPSQPSSIYQSHMQQHSQSQYMPPPAPPPVGSNTQPTFPSVSHVPTSTTSAYPRPQYNYNTNSTTPGHPTQIYPQNMPPLVGGNTTGGNNQQNNNFSNSVSNNDMVDLLKEKNVVSEFAEEPPISPLLTEENQQMNCSPEVMRCSLNVIPQTKELLNKSRLPLGILIHPFKDLESLSVIQGTKIVRCDSCKSYINPFVTFIDNARWRCSICYRVNDVPQEFLFDPITKTYGDPSRRPEVRFGTVEYTATADYMARPPQPAMYLFLLDVSHNAAQTGYLQSFCDILLENLNGLPGDARTRIGFLTYDSRIHFYDLSDRQNGTFRIMVAPDLDSKPEDFLPMPDGLMVTLCECRTTVEAFLNELPKIYRDNDETDSALGPALQVAAKLLDQTGGRITVVQTRIPNINPGALHELISTGATVGKEPANITPTSDFYKKLALNFASVQIACDLFLLNSHYIDLATLSCISKYSGGEVKYYPGFHSVQKPHEVERFENDLRRYLQRKIGFEAVMRLRLPPAMSIATHHGNGFVRSVDLLVLPNINPDAAFGLQITIEDTLVHHTTVTFQAALLYTSSKGERRIRVHSLSLPVSVNLSEIHANADQDAIVSLVAKMAADRSMTSSISEARDAMANVACDIVKACLSNSQSNRAFSLMVPYSLRLIPLYMLSMVKSTTFRAGGAPRLDDRAYYLSLCKALPVQYLIQTLYPDLYPIHTIEDKSQIIQDGEDELHIPQRVHLSYQNIDSHGAYILDTSEYIYVYIGKAISDHFVQNVFNLGTFSALPHDSYSLPELENQLSMKIHNFLSYLIQSRPHGIALHIMREDSSNRHLFTRHLVDDKSDSSMSYVEFLRYIREQIVK